MTSKIHSKPQYPWITINFDPQGTGLAITKAESGTDDMLLVHSPSQELPVLSGGYGVDRKIIAYNFFIIVGPASDPAHVAQMVDNVTKQCRHLQCCAKQSLDNRRISRFNGSQETDASGTNTAKKSHLDSSRLNYTQLVANATSLIIGSKLPILEWDQHCWQANYYGVG